jgi:hypothetical protein
MEDESMAYTKEYTSWSQAPDRTKEINQHLADRYFENHKDRIFRPPITKYVVIGDCVEEVKTVVVHEFSMGDVEDPDLFAAEPLIAWEKSEQGQWVMKNACDTPTWNRSADPVLMGFRYRITAKLTGPALTEWLLKYGEKCPAQSL